MMSVTMNGMHAREDRRETDVLHHALDHEHVHPDRRMNEPEFDRHDDDDAEPDRIEAELRDHREDDRHGQDDHGQRVHQAAEHDIHHHDQRQHAVAAEPQPGEELGHLLRRLRHGEEIAEQQRADQHREHRGGGARRLQQRARGFPARVSLPRATPINSAPPAPMPPASVGVNRPP